MLPCKLRPLLTSHPQCVLVIVLFLPILPLLHNLCCLLSTKSGYASEPRYLLIPPLNPSITSLIKNHATDSGYAKSTKTDPNFLTHHLSLPPLDLPWSELEDDDMIQDIEKATTQEEDIYDPLCKILSHYRARIYSQYFRTIYVKPFLKVRPPRIITSQRAPSTQSSLRLPGPSYRSPDTSPVRC